MSSSKSSGEIPDTIRSKLIDLSLERRRDGKPALTDTQLLEYHQNIRDGALIWMQQCVEYGRDKGIKAAQDLYEFSCRQIRILSRKM